MRKILYIVIAICPFLMIGQSTNKNYVKSTAYKQPYTELQVVAGVIDQDNKVEAVVYFDGLGRKIQSVNQRAGGDREDLITPTNYDIYGRSLKTWLPMPTDTGTGNFYAAQTGTFETEIKNYYKTKFPDDFFSPDGHTPDYDNPYSENLLEDSPSGRVIKQGAPGYDWRIHQGGEHTIDYEYDTNTGISEVQKFSVDLTNGVPSLVYDGHYVEGSLMKSIVKDENWKTADGEYGTKIEYTDKLGRVVLKRASVYDASLPAGDPNYHDTHYIYDDFGNLTFVLSPEASRKIVSGGVLATNSSTIISNLGYEYRYDDRNRLIWKKVAGKGYEIIVYNLLDQPILTQDAKMRAEDQSLFLFAKYDEFGRLAYTGFYDSPFAESTIQSTAMSGTVQYEISQSTTTNIGGTNVYYSNQSFPSTNLTVLTMQYYDDYIDLSGLTLPSYVYGETVLSSNKGQPTVSKVKVLDQPDWITSIVGYDQKGREIYSASQNLYLKTTDKVEKLVDFSGKILESKSIHKKNGNAAITVFDYFYYDHMDRLVTHKQKIDDEPIQLINEQYYDELGRLIQKDVGGQTALDGYTDLVNVDVAFEGTAVKTQSQNAWNAGLKTRGEIVDDGGVQYKVQTQDKISLVGLLKVTNPSPGWDTFDYAIYLSDSDTNFDGLKDVKLKINNVLGSVVTSYVAGDVFSVERDSTLIRFKKNDTQFYATSDFSATAMVGKAALYSSGGEIEAFELFGGNIDKKLQDIEYTHNVRGWLTEVNDIKRDALTSWGDDLFHLKINYNNVEESSTADPLFNGNIAQTLWQSRNTDINVHGYEYEYDNLNRLKTASSLMGDHIDGLGSVTLGYGVNTISYDSNGNIKNLIRNGSNGGTGYGQWDNLTYTYETDGNRLLKVDDSATQSIGLEGFKDVTGPEDDYVYDVNGNMTQDLNKGITAITYNHLNLPSSITVNNSNQNGVISYVYAANGVKLAKILTTEGATATYYAGNYTYHGNNIPYAELQFIGQPEGYIEPIAVEAERVKGFEDGQTTYSGYNYVFQYTDHLGNVRLSYSDSDLDGAITTSEIIEESNYYPFGLKQKGYNSNITGGNDLAQQWKYNGTQFNEDLGVNLYEMDLRQYDAAIARWIAIDPVTHHSMSTYTAFDNNPVYWSDPSGANSVGVTRKDGFYGNKVYNASETSYLYNYNQPNYLNSCNTCGTLMNGGDFGSHTLAIGFSGSQQGAGWNSQVNAGMATGNDPRLDVTINDPQVPKGGYFSAAVSIDHGFQTKEVLKVLGAGGGAEVGASVTLASAELLIGLESDEMYLNITFINTSSNVDIFYSHHELGAGTKFVISFDPRTFAVELTDSSLNMGPAGTVISENKMTNSFEFLSVATALGAGYTLSASISLENLTSPPPAPRSDGGYGIANDQLKADLGARIRRQAESGREAEARILTERSNALKRLIDREKIRSAIKHPSGNGSNVKEVIRKYY